MSSHKTCKTPGEVGEYIGVRRQMVYNYIAAKRLSAHKHEDGRMYVTMEDMEFWHFARKAKEQRKKEAIRRQLDGKY